MPLRAFRLELELDPVGNPGVWTEFVHYDSHVFGPFELDEEFEGLVNFRLTNLGTASISIDYEFGNTDLFQYLSPADADTINLGTEVGVDDVFLGSFNYFKDIVDQEVVSFSFVSSEGPKIVVSLRSSVTVSTNPYAGRYTIDLSGVLALHPTAVSVKCYPVVGSVSSFLTSLSTQIMVADFTAAVDLGQMFLDYNVGEQIAGFLFSVLLDNASEVLFKVQIDTQTGGFANYLYEFKYGDAGYLGDDQRGIALPGVDQTSDPTLLPFTDLRLENGWTFHLVPYVGGG